MSAKNFVAYSDAETIFSDYAHRINLSPTAFVGTEAEWNGLSATQKAAYSLVNIVDDYIDVDAYGVVPGYYNPTDGKFYMESTYTTEITGIAGNIYVDLGRKALYIYDSTNSAFVGEGGGNIPVNPTSTDGLNVWIVDE